MKKLAVAFLAMGLLGTWVEGSAAQAGNPGLSGDWEGVLDAGSQHLRLVLHFAEAPGNLSGSMTSLDQGNTSNAFDLVRHDGAMVFAGIESIRGSYQGTLSTDGKNLTGTWSQAGNVFALNLTRRAAAKKP